MYKSFVKPFIDFIAASVLFILFSPLFTILTILLFVANQGSPFFFQIRPGKNCKLFKIIKFKTMNDKKDSNGNLLPDMERLTSVGAFVRKTSLDELPQLLNVIKGDMSFIGPRPLLPQYLPLYNSFQNRRHEVKPGITGWAQVNGRNAIGWIEKFNYDVWYVDHIGAALDLKILLLTITKVISSSDVNASQNATMDSFKGN